MRFTTARPEVSCHPESLLPGARTVVSAALCYWAPEPPLEPGQGRLAALHVERRLRRAAGAARGAGRAPRRLLPGPRRRERPRRPRGRRARGCRLLRQEHDADHTPPRLLGRAGDARDRRRAGAVAAARPRLRLVHALHRGLPDRRARRARGARCDQVPLVRDAVAGADPRGVPGRARGDGLRLRHLPGRVPVEPRRREAARGRAAPRGRRAARLARRLARGRPGRAPRPVSAPLRAAPRRALPAAKRARRARQRASFFTRSRDTPSSCASVFARSRSSRRSSGGSITTASPRHASTSPTIHSLLPNFSSATALPSRRSVAPQRSTARRAGSPPP